MSSASAPISLFDDSDEAHGHGKILSGGMIGEIALAIVVDRAHLRVTEVFVERCASDLGAAGWCARCNTSAQVWPAEAGPNSANANSMKRLSLGMGCLSLG